MFVLCKPFFRNNSNLPVGQCKFLYSVQNVITQLYKWNLVRSKVGKRAHIEPVIVFDHFDVKGRFADKEVLISRLLLYNETFLKQLLMFVTEPFKYIGECLA